jgi:hypothetical protein
MGVMTVMIAMIARTAATAAFADASAGKEVAALRLLCVARPRTQLITADVATCHPSSG